MSEPRYKLVTGKFYARFDERRASDQPQPDGDTVRFVPDNPFALISPDRFKRYGFRGPDIREFGISIRFEGIDALETHFLVKGISPARELHQNLPLANAARDKLLELLGFTEVVFDDGNPNVIDTVKNNPVSGFVIANGIDGNGRLLGFAYSGPTGAVDPKLEEAEKKGLPKSESGPVILGRPNPQPIFLTSEIMKKSINWKLIDAGLAYAELYTSLPLSLSRVIADRVRELRSNPGINTIWGQEHINTTTPFTWDKTMDTLQDKIIFPKVFRRLAQYAADISIQARPKFFLSWLKDSDYLLERDDRLLLPPSTQYPSPPYCEFGNLHDMIQITSESTQLLTFRFTQNPEDIIVLPDSV